MIKYIDLFSGIGGFHQALKDLGNFECVFASEIDPITSNIYSTNHHLKPAGDISKINSEDIPKHDLICAGFPCQPFSKGGKQGGFLDIRGTLFYEIIRIASFHKPQFILLENVANLLTHDEGNTYKTIIHELNQIGYQCNPEPILLSPKQFGIPVLRNRAYIIAKLSSFNSSLNTFEYKTIRNISIEDIIDKSYCKDGKLKLTSYEIKALKIWNEFYSEIVPKTIGFPIWYEYFKIKPDPKEPTWKKNIILKNNQLYLNNKNFINKWEKKHNYLKGLNPTHRKFEWQCGTDCANIYEGIIQFRPSGIRVKRPNYFSTLVAMNHPQIYGPLGRKLHPNEVKLLQSFPEDFILHSNYNIALKHLGNSVNVQVIQELTKHFILNGD